MLRLIVLLVLALFSLVSCDQETDQSLSELGEAAPQKGAAVQPKTFREGSIPSAVDKALPSVVSIRSTRTAKAQRPRRRLFDDPFPRRFFGPLPEGHPEIPREFEQQGLGSGVVVSERYVLTNNHVVENADQIKIKSSEKREYKVEVVGTDPKSDLAVLKLEGDDGGEDLKPIQWGDSSSLRLGEVVVAIGNPFGVGQTVTMGIVSATGRANMGIVDYEDFIQTDAAINPGNSGGALINMRGELVGINTAIFSRTGGSMGIGFAIPSSMARPIMKSLIEHSKVVRGWLGVSIQDVDAELAKAMALDTTTGVLVADVQERSPADKAGLKRGDVIVAVDERKVETTGELRNLIAAAGANVKTQLTLLRDGKRQKQTVELGELPANLGSRGRVPPAPSESQLEGLVLEELTPHNRQRFELPEDIEAGIVVTAVQHGSAAHRAGLAQGDVILEVNRQRVTSIQELKTEWRKAKDRVLLLVNRDGWTRYVAMPN